MSRFTPPRPWIHPFAVSVVLFGGTVLLFSRAMQAGFVNYDDPGYVTENPHVQGGLSWAGVAWAFTGRTDYWHPLTWLSHMLDWELFGAAPWGHHTTSVLWHALNAVLAFFAFRRLAGGLWVSALAAALFAWHPLRVESVAWVTERKDVMSGAFFLLTLLAYARYVDDRRADRPWWRAYALTLACFVAGLMSKPMLVTLPLILLILDFWPFARCPASLAGLRRLLLEKVPFFALSVAVAVVTLLMQRREDAFVLDLPPGARAGNAVVSIARYLARFFWPVDLSVCYPHPGYWPTAVVVAAAALTLTLSVFAWRNRRSRPWIAVGWLWFLVALLPVLGLVQAGFQAMADRYTYLPMLGVELALLWSLRPRWNSTRVSVLATVVVAVVVVACAARTWDQQRVWRDSVALFERAVAVASDNDLAEDFLASALFAAGRFDEAALHAERALALNPRNATAAITLAGTRERQGRLDDAVELYRTALTLRPDDPEVQCQLGMLAFHQGRAGEARRLMTQALRAKPQLSDRTVELALSALQHHDTTSARFLSEAVISVAPERADAHVALGTVLLTIGDRAGGLAAWRHALALDPNFPGLRERLAEQSPR